jgi:predicted CopG family antitoxin
METLLGLETKEDGAVPTPMTQEHLYMATLNWAYGKEAADDETIAMDDSAEIMRRQAHNLEEVTTRTVEDQRLGKVGWQMKEYLEALEKKVGEEYKGLAKAMEVSTDLNEMKPSATTSRKKREVQAASADIAGHIRNQRRKQAQTARGGKPTWLTTHHNPSKRIVEVLQATFRCVKNVAKELNKVPQKEMCVTKKMTKEHMVRDGMTAARSVEEDEAIANRTHLVAIAAQVAFGVQEITAIEGKDQAGVAAEGLRDALTRMYYTVVGIRLEAAIRQMNGTIADQSFTQEEKRASDDCRAKLLKKFHEDLQLAVSELAATAGTGAPGAQYEMDSDLCKLAVSEFDYYKMHGEIMNTMTASEAIARITTGKREDVLTRLVERQVPLVVALDERFWNKCNEEIKKEVEEHNRKRKHGQEKRDARNTSKTRREHAIIEKRASFRRVAPKARKLGNNTNIERLLSRSGCIAVWTKVEVALKVEHERLTDIRIVGNAPRRAERTKKVVEQIMETFDKETQVESRRAFAPALMRMMVELHGVSRTKVDVRRYYWLTVNYFAATQVSASSKKVARAPTADMVDEAIANQGLQTTQAEEEAEEWTDAGGWAAEAKEWVERIHQAYCVHYEEQQRIERLQMRQQQQAARVKEGKAEKTIYDKMELEADKMTDEEGCDKEVSDMTQKMLKGVRTDVERQLKKNKTLDEKTRTKFGEVTEKWMRKVTPKMVKGIQKKVKDYQAQKRKDVKEKLRKGHEALEKKMETEVLIWQQEAAKLGKKVVAKVDDDWDATGNEVNLRDLVD